MSKVVNLSGTIIDYEGALQMMDDDLRDYLHMDLFPCSNQEFFTAYEIVHKEKFGEDFELSKVSPVW